MNSTQIKYFLAAARCLNFTQAAKELYISQPALSKQITAMENELNMMLFIRSAKKVRLTPAAAVLQKELPEYQAHYNEIIRKAKEANEGLSGELRIGILEGQMVGKRFTEAYGSFCRTHPNISVRLQRNSFHELRDLLENGSIDLALSLDFDISGNPSFVYELLEKNPALLVAAKNYPLDHISSLSDLKEKTFIVVDENDSYAGPHMLVEACKKSGFTPLCKTAPTLESVMLWVEAGLGIGVVNTMNNLTINPNIRILDEIPLGSTQMTLAWKRENLNPIIALFTNTLTSDFSDCEV